MMLRTLRSPLVALALLVLVVVMATAVMPAQAALVNNNLHRTIDLSSQGSAISRETVAVSVLNSGSDSQDTYHITLDASRLGHLVHLAAVQRIADGPNPTLAVQQGQLDDKTHMQYIMVKLSEPLAAGERTIIDIDMVFKQALSPLPRELPQSGKQLVIYKDNLFFSSPYQTEKSKTTIKLPTSATPLVLDAGSYTPASQSGGKIVYGPLASSLAPFSHQPLSLHFESYKVGLVSPKWHREVWVSMWSNLVEVEEHAWVRHDGAKLQGQFNRKEYMQHQQTLSTTPVIPRLELELPHGASDVYYRDEIGNVSTSNFRLEPRKRRSLLSFAPRYPLFGGWQYNWYHGYGVPASEYLQDVPSKQAPTGVSEHVLKVPMVRGLKDVLIEQLTVKVVLPEGAKHVQVKTPYAVDRIYNTTTFYYLDTTGRPTVVLEKSNVIDEHGQEVEIHFQYPSSAFWQKPMAVGAAALGLLVAAVLYASLDVRLDRRKAAA
ncbi:dolichyl-diphosphooligosaccharide--protein glycosyltransferase subunit 1 [Sorochytrium milnesiophthora]